MRGSKMNKRRGMMTYTLMTVGIQLLKESIKTKKEAIDARN